MFKDIKAIVTRITRSITGFILKRGLSTKAIASVVVVKDY